MPKVSVIIPIYNVENYVIECLESVRKQTLQDFEVIIVNDGTKDRSAEFAAEYIHRYNLNNFILINKDNGGVSSARNVGIEHAVGEWITFIDSDDYVEETFLENMVAGVEKYPADYCTAGYTKYYEKTKEIKPNVVTNFFGGTLTESLNRLFFLSPFAKLFSTKIVKENKIRFDCRTRFGEDRVFIFDYLCYVERCVIIEDRSYTYRIREDSATSRIVRPQEKQHLWEHTRNFWINFENQEFLLESFKKNHHLAHNILDSLLADVINAVVTNDRMFFGELVSDPICRSVLENYKHKAAPKKEKLLVELLRRRLYLLCKMVIKLYYNENLHKLLKPIVKAMG